MNVEQHGYGMTPPLPNPDLEDHEHELWGQNVCSDFVTVEKMHSYGKACAAAATERAAKVCRNMGALEAMEGEEYGSAAMVRVADRQAELCAAAIEKTT